MSEDPIAMNPYTAASTMLGRSLERTRCIGIVLGELGRLPAEIMPEDWRASMVYASLRRILDAIENPETI